VYANGKTPAVLMTLAEESVQNRLQKPMYRYTVFTPYTDKVTLSDIISKIRLYQANKNNWKLASLEDLFLDVFTLPRVTFEINRITIDVVNSLEPQFLDRGSFSLNKLEELEIELLDIFKKGNILKLKRSEEIYDYVRIINDKISEDIKRESDRIQGELERGRKKLRV